ncbi:MAG: molybdopterin-guanine dinucleotide biosynthesis protein B [Candidatus Cloacimonadales bacterium]|nr:molybdopterin-guanine dinucleotide biosynthesis protein B [Candidatus Cloacimonadales bacterium]
MKVFSVSGYHRTGKTTVVVELIKELKSRGYKVVSIKDIHSENFTMEKEGSNSWKHWQASGDVVIARGQNETYMIWHRSLSLNEMLDKLDADWVVVEGMRSEALPRIICAENQNELEELIDGTVFAISGKYSDDHVFYKDLPVFKAEKDIKDFTDRVEAKVFDVLPLVKGECCCECGLSCREMVVQILAGNKSRDICKTDRDRNVVIKFNGNDLKIVPYVQQTFIDVVIGYLQNLKGYKKGSKITIEIDDK